MVKFGGCSAGGTERALQTLAANLPKEKFVVDYYYCDAAPYIGSDWKHPDTDLSRKSYLEDKQVNLIKFNVAFKDVRHPTHPWVDTNFWEVFCEENYDIIQTARAGHSEYPFTQINKIPQIDLVTLPGMAERKANVYKTIHISNFQAETWIRAGGDPDKIEIIPLFGEAWPRSEQNYRNELNLENKFVFGLHQRNDNGIFSPVVLEAYKQLETSETAFLLMGGGEQYQTQARNLNLKNFHHIEHSGDRDNLDKFLGSLDVFAHGRSDGETFGLAIAEAMYYGLPVISHIAPALGHVETIGDGGIVVNSINEYADELLKLKNNKNYYSTRSIASKERFTKELSLETNMKKWVAVYESCMNKKQLDDMEPDDFWEEMWESE